ncbi:hypothetical protein AB4254_12025 [Vibrio breoganii]
MNEIAKEWLNQDTNEVFDMLMRRFHVGEAKKLIRENTVEGEVRDAHSYKSSQLGNFSFGIGLDKEHIAKLTDEDLQRPLIMAEFQKGEYILIDGHHRLSYAKENDKDVSIWFLTPEETELTQNCPLAFKSPPVNDGDELKVVKEHAAKVHAFAKRNLRVLTGRESIDEINSRVDKMSSLLDGLEELSAANLVSMEHQDLAEGIEDFNFIVQESLDQLSFAAVEGGSVTMNRHVREIWTACNGKLGAMKELGVAEKSRESVNAL